MRLRGVGLRLGEWGEAGWSVGGVLPSNFGCGGRVRISATLKIVFCLLSVLFMFPER